MQIKALRRPGGRHAPSVATSLRPSDQQELPMTTTTHLDSALAEALGDKAHAIHELKVKDAHFRGLLEQNHELYLKIQQIEKGMAAVEDAVLETLRKQRLALLDQIAARL
jgi:uncharacterized protein YdcH (DUF465 family)